MNGIKEQIDLKPEQISAVALNPIARSVMDAVKKAFADPIIAADYEKWLEARNAEGISNGY